MPYTRRQQDKKRFSKKIFLSVIRDQTSSGVLLITEKNTCENCGRVYNSLRYTLKYSTRTNMPQTRKNQEDKRHIKKP